MAEGYNEIDPNIFEEDNVLDFELGLSAQADRFSKAIETLETYNPDGTPISGELDGTVGDVVKRFTDETGVGLSLNLGGANITATPMDAKDSKPVTININMISSKDYIQAQKDKDDASKNLVGYVVGYQAHVHDQLQEIVESDEVLQRSWEHVWRKLQTIIKTMSSSSLVDIVDFFDSLVAIRYPSSFDPMDAHRGAEARLDISAWTFYRVMGPHLKRAIQRKGEDNWSG